MTVLRFADVTNGELRTEILRLVLSVVHESGARDRRVVLFENPPLLALRGSLVEVSLADGTLLAGRVTAVSTEALTLETGNTDRAATLIAGSGTSTLSFRYVVTQGDLSGDLDVVSSAALSLNGGSITDTAGNAATLALPAPGGAGSLSQAKALVVFTNAAPQLSPPAPLTFNDTAGADVFAVRSGTLGASDKDGPGPLRYALAGARVVGSKVVAQGS